jgi:hypothetical protein
MLLLAGLGYGVLIKTRLQREAVVIKVSQQGYEAGKNGSPVQTNPYPVDAQPGSDWSLWRLNWLRGVEMSGRLETQKAEGK